MNKDKSILQQKPAELLTEFLNLYRETNGIDINKARNLINGDVSYFDTAYQKNLAALWYEGLENNQINYDVYCDEYYFTELWICWHLYSRKYIMSLVKKQITSLCPDVRSVLDLGCGLGLTTAALKQIFPNASVTGTNLKGPQFTFCNVMSRLFDFNVVETVGNIYGNVDMIFASEYFEHIPNTLDHLQIIIDDLSPKYFILANSFNTRSVGHFTSYSSKSGECGQKEISRKFNKQLVENNYKRMNIKMWNNTPAVWEKT